MFYDRKLHHNLLPSLAFELNHPACRLAMMVEWYRARGERTLPVQYLRDTMFTRREWELATKGTRKKTETKRLIDPAPAKDGCEAIGLISEYKEVCKETGRPKTYWVIGEVDEEALAKIREQRQAASFDVIEDPEPKEPKKEEATEPSVKPNTATSAETAYDRGYADGEANGYARGVDDTEIKHKNTRRSKGASIVLAFRKAPTEPPVKRGDAEGMAEAVRTNFKATGLTFCQMVHHRDNELHRKLGTTVKSCFTG